MRANALWLAVLLMCIGLAAWRSSPLTAVVITPGPMTPVGLPKWKVAADQEFEKAKKQPGYSEVRKMGKNPLAGDLAATRKGVELFATSCAPCHGPAGGGDGQAGMMLNPRPLDLTRLGDYKYGPGDLGIFRTVPGWPRGRGG